MRVTPEILHRAAQENVRRRARSNRGLISAYLHGSLLEDDPLLGGTGDVDLVFIQNERPQREREIVRLTDEVHLDIAHHFQGTYRQGRELRLHPWMGPTIFNAQILHDTRHFMEFVQASVRGMFNRADYVLKRAQNQAQHARQIWMGYHFDPPTPGPNEVSTYLKAVNHAVNAIASLTGPPLAERRFLLEFPSRAEAVGRPGMYAGVLGLIGGPKVDAETLKEWLVSWESSLDALGESPPARLHPYRRTYYLGAFHSMLDSEQPLNALWPLLRTWTFAVCSLEEDHQSVEAWQAACQHLGLLGDGFDERLKALDAYLDMVEETLEVWGHQQGA